MVMLQIEREVPSDRPGHDRPVLERLRYVMGNADPSARLHLEQTAADAIDRIAELEAALKFYADEWLKGGDDGLPFEPTDALWDDKGATARKALSR